MSKDLKNNEILSDVSDREIQKKKDSIKPGMVNLVHPGH
jgi:hypothetical protein